MRPKVVPKYFVSLLKGGRWVFPSKGVNDTHRRLTASETQRGSLVISTVPTLMLMMTIHHEEPVAVLRSAAVRSGDAEAK